MLTAALIQARVYKGEVRPRYLAPDDAETLQLAARLIELFEEHVGQPRHALEDELEALLGSGTAFQLHRALAKLLSDRCSFDTEAAADPVELRRAVFEAAATAYRQAGPLPFAGRDAANGGFVAEPAQEVAVATPAPGAPAGIRFDRETLIASLAADFGIGPAQLETGLYADLKGEQLLLAFDRCEPAWLLRRYNAALAQGVLLRATRMTIEISGQTGRRYRELLRKIKFFQLLARVRGSAAAGYRIELDGPLSLFQASQKYGLQMASFLPTLLHFDGWALTAQVRWGRERRDKEFRLKASELTPVGRYLAGQWQPEEIQAFPGRFAQLDSEWEISTEAELIDLGGQGVLVPDFVFRHRPSGFKIYMEVLGFWRRGAVESRLALLAEHGPPHFVLALSKGLAAGRETLGELADDVYLFRQMPIARQVVALLDRKRAGAQPSEA